MNALSLFARQELTLAVRSRWTQIFAGVFGLLALAVAGAGYALSGGSGMQDFARTASSLVQLVLLLVPLTALLTGVLSLVPERGGAELVLSQPVSRAAVLGGKILGLFLALAAAQGIGFGVAGVVIFRSSGAEGLGGFLALIGASLVLTGIFLALSALIAVHNLGRKQPRALAIALVLWFGLVVLFDVAALGIASMLRSAAASRLLIAAVLVNPIDATRTGALLAIEGTAAFGAASLALLRVTRGPTGAAVLISLSLLLWLVVPLLLAARRFRDADI